MVRTTPPVPPLDVGIRPDRSMIHVAGQTVARRRFETDAAAGSATALTWRRRPCRTIPAGQGSGRPNRRFSHTGVRLRSDAPSLSFVRLDARATARATHPATGARDRNTGIAERWAW